MGSGSEKLKKLLQLARKQIQQGDRREALSTYKKALKLDPGNQQIMERINIVEREIAAMEKFNKSRSSRTHSAGRNISSSGFVDDCIKRSDEALQAGDAVRALQELERAKRHDPENSRVTKKISEVKLLMSIDDLADTVRSRLNSGDPVLAVEKIRKIFEIDPSAPVLPELLNLAENYVEPAAKAEPKVAAAVTAEKKTEKTETRTAPPPARKRRSSKPSGKPAAEKEDGGRKKTFIIIAGLVAVLIIVFGLIKMMGGGEPTEEQPEVIPAQPFTANIVVPGVENASVMVDGTPLEEGASGVFIYSDTVFTEWTFTVTAPGFESRSWTTAFQEGETSTDTLSLDTLGTSVVQVSLNYQMPEGEEDPGPDAVTYMVDGELIEGSMDSIPTGEHVFQAMLEGYRSMPESILVVNPQDFSQTLNILDAQQAQITVQLAGDTPGNASFFIDGDRVATGRRFSEVRPFGSYYIQVQMQDREDFAVTIDLGQEGYSRTVSLAEITETGQLMVGPEPWSDVYVDGDLVGRTPFGGVELDPGSYTVRLSNPDFQDDVRTVTITAGETTSIQFNAVAAEGPEEIPEDVPEDTVAVEQPEEDLPISQPFPIQQTAPAIPSQARARGDIHGFVTLSVLVGTDGTVQDVSVVNDPLGMGCGQAAVDAVRNWVFSPAMQGDQPVEVPTSVQIRFDID